MACSTGLAGWRSCSGLLSTRKRWGLRLWRRLLFWDVRRIPIWLRVFFSCTSLLFSLAISAIDVGAQATNTPEPVPLFATPTPLATLIPWYGPRPCPDGGTPTGWGMVTPSPRWMVECVHCVPGAYPTATPAAYTPPFTMPTAIPMLDLWATSTPSITPTATPVPPTGIYYVTVDGSVVDQETPVLGKLIQWYANAAYCIRVGYVGSISWSGGGHAYPSGVDLVVERSNSQGSFVSSEYYYDVDGEGEYGYRETQDWSVGVCRSSGRSGSCDVEGVLEVVGVGSPAGYSHKAHFRYGSDVYGSGNWFPGADFDVTYDWQWCTGVFTPGNGTVTPEPTVTPTPRAGYEYCYTVEDIEDMGPEQGLPTIEIGYSSCYGIDAIDVDIPVVGEISTPSFSVCFDRITFGEVQFLGIELDMDIVASVLAAVAVLRLFWKS